MVNMVQYRMVYGLCGLQPHSMNVALLQPLFWGLRVRIMQIKNEVNSKAYYLSLEKFHGIEGRKIKINLVCYSVEKNSLSV